jgi:hypothetical protein
MPTRYYLRFPQPERLRDAGAFAFLSQGPEGLAEELEAALRNDALFERWRAAQEDPDEVDPALGATDPGARVVAEQSDLHIDATVTTTLGSAIVRHRLRLLAGSVWQLVDIKSV